MNGFKNLLLVTIGLALIALAKAHTFPDKA
jgi:hypothetical protein